MDLCELYPETLEAMRDMALEKREVTLLFLAQINYPNIASESFSMDMSLFKENQSPIEIRNNSESAQNENFHSM